MTEGLTIELDKSDEIVLNDYYVTGIDISDNIVLKFRNGFGLWRENMLERSGIAEVKVDVCMDEVVCFYIKKKTLFGCYFEICRYLSIKKIARLLTRNYKFRVNECLRGYEQLYLRCSVLPTEGCCKRRSDEVIINIMGIDRVQFCWTG